MENKMREEQDKRIRKQAKRVMMLLVFVFFIVFIRIFELQIVDSAEMTKYIDRQAETDRKLQSPRGTIYDRNGKVLAISEVAQSLYADPNMLRRDAKNYKASGQGDLIGVLSSELAPYVKLDAAEVQHRLQRNTGFVWLARTMDRSSYEAVRQIIRKHKVTALRFVDENRRYYPNGMLAAQLIGFVGENDKGLDGIEMVLDSVIRGNVQSIKTVIDPAKVPILDSALTNVLPEKERTVKLTIDSTIQFVAEKALNGIMEKNHPEGAAIIIMNPKTGEILAMASRPNFDPNDFGKGNQESYKNRAVVNLYEPGSTFKPIMAAAAVDSGAWSLNSSYVDTGAIRVHDRVIHNWDKSGMGNVTLREILKFSINTGMAHIALQTGGDTLTSYAKKFGFGKMTGIELPGEGTGILFNAKKMSQVDTAIMGIGQGVAVTPLQMVQAFGAIANGGKMMKPFVIQEIDNPDGSVYKKTLPKQVGQPIKKETADAISRILSEEITSGGGQNAKIDGYTFCGKTGTAQRLNKEGTGYAMNQHIGSFIGFGPFEDPQYVVLIVVDNPSGVYYGAQVAAPVFKEMMTEIVRFKGIRPSHPTDVKEIASSSQNRKQRDFPAITETDKGIVLPSFIGWDTREVNSWLHKAGLGFVPRGMGYAVYQSPREGQTVAHGSTVTVTFSR